MRDTPEGIKCLIIIQYIHTIRLSRNLATYKESVAKVNTHRTKLDKEITFYAEHR